VSTVLKRLVEKKKVEKKDKMYIWKSGGGAKTVAE
jgi:predicted transcriptional regulator